ncbi:DUF2382 domain-containing protein [Streptomyces sp. TP-A0874]|uniref:DUF2382 domain-containing protein n=1 Tax=Streptomyces sp. TP-A0874 TaxID=549819 RepID=UPI0008533E0A|nr:PRC and DUF2382 domain-containing protein [Streptomyces sp. TP-A0874]
MTAPQGPTPQDLAGLTVADKEGQKVGTVQQIYLDDASGAPEWITVRTGLFGSRESFVPLSGSQRSEGRLQVPYAKEEIKEAPRIEADGHLAPSEEEDLYRHYGMSGRAAPRAEETGAPPETRGTAETAGMAGTTGRPESTGMTGPTETFTDRETAGEPEMAGSGVRGMHEMTRSEEKAFVDTEEREAGHARLRKRVVSEDVTTSVPVSHEEVHVTREPVNPDEPVGEGRTGRIEEGEVEVTLHEERPVVHKETVPVERVRLETEKVTEQEEISTKVNKEQIEYESDRGDREGRGGPEDFR